MSQAIDFGRSYLNGHQNPLSMYAINECFMAII